MFLKVSFVANILNETTYIDNICLTAIWLHMCAKSYNMAYYVLATDVKINTSYNFLF